MYSNLRFYSFIYSYGQDGWTPVYAAAFNGHEGVVKELIAAGASMNQLITGGANINQADEVRHNHKYL